jgi:hypothetical protein
LRINEAVYLSGPVLALGAQTDLDLLLALSLHNCVMVGKVVIFQSLGAFVSEAEEFGRVGVGARCRQVFSRD